MAATAAPGQALPADAATPINQTDAQTSRSVLLMPWHAGDAQAWKLLTRSSTSGNTYAGNSLGFHGLGFASLYGGSLEYMLNPSWTARAGVTEKSWLGVGSVGNCLTANVALQAGGCTAGNVVPSLLNGALGATFNGDNYSVSMDLTTTQPSVAAPMLPRVVPNVPITASVAGLPFASLEGSTDLHARGRLALDDSSGIDFGASVGRIRLLPGNVLGVDSLGQRSLSFGLDSGSVSGRIIGRVVQPETGVDTNILGPDHRWTSVDLGVTWRLPWQGSLSFGTQNLWTSGHAPQPKVGPQPDQSRIPYVQYHQDF
ncbi:MAG TPA: hypothetical protein VF271_11225 [Rhodanobacteraceae bacterium]